MVSPSQLGLAALTLATIVGVAVVLLRRSAFGRAYRACADDPGAAALMGVDVDRTVAPGLHAGQRAGRVAGFVIATHYGVVSFAMGTMLG